MPRPPPVAVTRCPRGPQAAELSAEMRSTARTHWEGREEHVQAGTIVTFATSAPGTFVLRFHEGYPGDGRAAEAEFKLWPYRRDRATDAGARRQVSGAVTPYALFVLAMAAPVAVVLVFRGVISWRRSGRTGWRRPVLAFAAAAFLLYSAFAVAGWAMPDALDALPAEQRASVGPALASSPECGLLPFARVLDVEVVRPPDGSGPVLRYVCGITPLGFPRLRNEADCGDGQWMVRGVLEIASAGDC